MHRGLAGPEDGRSSTKARPEARPRICRGVIKGVLADHLGLSAARAGRRGVPGFAGGRARSRARWLNLAAGGPAPAPADAMPAMASQPSSAPAIDPHVGASHEAARINRERGLAITPRQHQTSTVSGKRTTACGPTKRSPCPPSAAATCTASLVRQDQRPRGAGAARLRGWSKAGAPGRAARHTFRAGRRASCSASSAARLRLAKSTGPWSAGPNAAPQNRPTPPGRSRKTPRRPVPPEAGDGDDDGRPRGFHARDIASGQVATDLCRSVARPEFRADLHYTPFPLPDQRVRMAATLTSPFVLPS